ncbi:pyrroline-5-carboxylate reductase [Paenibacillus sediminis]|uniref:Pyrroline-5-carboxylate reductase n=1 Tax=Paenibacillus sediminis TaxID=664909 RepID=A0ABS4GZX0_9BACL|nr:pyrroline-5-carboxylate reductase [Paenibacillus sediminis]MBP1935821.1 pyrroline-5-carboxylate reductase [Paenibacillus sediminis]
MYDPQSSKALIEQNVCFYGAGSMAEAIVQGLISRSVILSGQISMLNNSNNDRLKQLEDRYGVRTANDPNKKIEILSKSQIIVLAMKPKDAAEAIRLLSPILSEDQLLVSVIAGLTIETMQSLLGRKQPIARTMPNTSSTIGLGATGISFSKETTEEQQRIVRTMFEAVGTVSIIEEDKIEILTGVSGSGPAYIYYFMEAMIEAGVEGGLTPEQAKELTVQTVLGAARMVAQTGENPADLRAKVTSPNGSTQAAIEVMAKGNVFNTIKAAVFRCAERSKEMGAELEEAIK